MHTTKKVLLGMNRDRQKQTKRTNEEVNRSKCWLLKNRIDFIYGNTEPNSHSPKHALFLHGIFSHDTKEHPTQTTCIIRPFSYKTTTTIIKPTQITMVDIFLFAQDFCFNSGKFILHIHNPVLHTS